MLKQAGQSLIRSFFEELEQVLEKRLARSSSRRRLSIAQPETLAGYSSADARWYSLHMDDLSGKVALVTGASRGIGRAIAVALAQAGADIAINFLNRAEEAETAAEEVRRCGRRSAILQADVSVASDVHCLI